MKIILYQNQETSVDTNLWHKSRKVSISAVYGLFDTSKPMHALLKITLEYFKSEKDKAKYFEEYDRKWVSSKVLAPITLNESPSSNFIAIEEGDGDFRIPPNTLRVRFMFSNSPAYQNIEEITVEYNVVEEIKGSVKDMRSVWLRL